MPNTRRQSARRFCSLGEVVGCNGVDGRSRARTCAGVRPIRRIWNSRSGKSAILNAWKFAADRHRHLPARGVGVGEHQHDHRAPVGDRDAADSPHREQVDAFVDSGGSRRGTAL
jgi:hypothetical protein